MELKEECKASIYEYASLERQNTAAITGLYKDYVGMVITVLTYNYQKLKAEGATTWSIPEDVKAVLDADKPY
jgi:hypothetical protein